MRIIAGRWRGRRVEAPPGRGTRPMLDRVREALFSVLGDRVREATVWDLFAGSGSLGLEALSRGAGRAWFVERARPALRALQANLAACQGEEGVGSIHPVDAWDPALPESAPPDLIFMDPPYPQVAADPRLARERLARLVARLAPGGLLVFHYDADAPASAEAVAGMAGDFRAWGSSAIALLEADPGGGEES